jgi:hypothetical protein
MGSVQTFTETLDANNSAPRRARAWVGERLDAVLERVPHPEVRADIVLCASELVTSAILAGCTVLALRMQFADHRVRVSLSDDTAPPTDRRSSEFLVQWQGYRVVEALSDKWGITAVGTGREAWAEFRVDRMSRQVEGGASLGLLTTA